MDTNARVNFRTTPSRSRLEHNTQLGDSPRGPPSRQMTRIVRPTRRDFLRLAALTGLGTAALGVPRGSLRAASPLFEEIPSSVSGITWVHDNAMSPDRYLPETMGPGVAFCRLRQRRLDGPVHGQQRPSRLLHAENAAQERALQEQPRRHLHRCHRQGGSADQAFRHGRRRRRLRQRRLPGPAGHQLRPPTLYKNNGNGTFTDVTEKSGPRRPRLDDKRRLVRLRQRRQAGSVSLQLRAVLAEEQHLLRRQQAREALLLHPARLQADAERRSFTTTATAPSRSRAAAPTSSAPSARPWASSRPTSTTTG